LILGFDLRPSNALLPLWDYESHTTGSIPILPAGKNLMLVIGTTHTDYLEDTLEMHNRQANYLSCGFLVGEAANKQRRGQKTGLFPCAADLNH
jgi:hypothetical protein